MERIGHFCRAAGMNPECEMLPAIQKKTRIIGCFGVYEFYRILMSPQGESKYKSKGSVSQLMDDLDIIYSVEQVEVMVNSIQKGAENQKTSALVMLENLLGVFLICSTLFRSKSNLHEYAARLRGASTR